MKTKSIFISLILLTGMAFTQQAVAQQKEKKTEQGWFTSEYWSPVYCDGVMIDLLEGGELRVHYVVHYKEGVKYFEIDQLKGYVTSGITGETFKVREVDKYYFTDHWYVTWNYNLIGDMGSHYVGTLTYSYWTGEITVDRTGCN